MKGRPFALPTRPGLASVSARSRSGVEALPAGRQAPGPSQYGISSPLRCRHRTSVAQRAKTPPPRHAQMAAAQNACGRHGIRNTSSARSPARVACFRQSSRRGQVRMGIDFRERKLLRGLVAIVLTLCLTPSLAQAAGDANHPAAGECPSETEASAGFRPFLPDCRAYELVTPPLKNGQPPVTNNSAVATDGAGLAFSSLGAFNEPGNDSTTEGGEYASTRAATGWATVAVNPSAAEFQGGSPDQESSSHETLDYSNGLGTSLFLQAPRGMKPIDARFYTRNVSTGSLTEIGPLLSPEVVAAWSPAVAEAGETIKAGYLGASADLSHVLFNLHSVRSDQPLPMLWPGDTSLRTGVVYSLYQYATNGTDEPELVGVGNQTSLSAAAAAEHKAHINEAAELTSQCGVILGGVAQYGGQNDARTAEEAYNAISRSGETLIFTALEGGCEETLQVPAIVGAGPAVPEIYARIDRERSVKISEPAPSDCTECNLTEVTQLKYDGKEFEGTQAEKESEREHAAQLRPSFQGASEDGRRVYFTSQQKLFSGARGESGTNLYEYDFDGIAGHRVTLIASELAPSAGRAGGVVRIAENGSRVFFVSSAVLAGTGPNEFGGAPQPGANNLYAYDTAARKPAFVAALAQEDQPDWLGSDSRPVEATSDGRFLLFTSTAALTPDATGASRQLYRYAAEPSQEEEARSVPRLMRVSVGARGSYECPITKAVQQGYNCDGNAAPEPSSGVFAPEYERGSAPDYRSVRKSRPAGVAITADGSKVFFQSPVALRPGAVNSACVFESFGECRAAAQNVYEWQGGQIYLISDGVDTHPLFASSATKLVGANPSGSDVFLTTADPLVPQDTDNQIDVYDAREGGGFPAPIVSSACQGAACRTDQGSAPAISVPGSSTLFGAANLPSGASAPPGRSKTAAQIRAEQLSRALKACTKKPRNRRAACRRQARKRYGTKTTTSSSKRHKNRRTKATQQGRHRG
jgi:hypothetical protein